MAVDERVARKRLLDLKVELERLSEISEGARATVMLDRQAVCRHAFGNWMEYLLLHTPANGLDTSKGSRLCSTHSSFSPA